MRGQTTLPARLCSHLINTSRAFLAQTSLPYSHSSLAISSLLLRHGFISSLTLGTPTHPSPADFATLPAPAKRIWLAHKHRNGQPVLRRMNLVSKPSLRVHVTNQELGRLLHGKRTKNVAGLGMGEVVVVKVDHGAAKATEAYKEGWEAWRAGLGGEVVCRVG